MRATRLELERCGVVDTVDGQIALQLARKLTDPSHVSPGLAKELRATIAEAKGADAPAPIAPAAEPDDEVERARKAREHKAREAAARRA